MIQAVVVSVLLVSSTIALPLTTQEHETSQIQSGTPLTTSQQQIEKTGIQSSQTYTQTGFNQVSGQHTQGEKTGLQTPTEVQTSQEPTAYNQQNAAVPKVEPVNAGQTQSYTNQNSILLPVTPLSVVPVSPNSQILRPVVVPVEALVDGRVIITPISSIQQKNFHQEVFAALDNHQQGVQPTNYPVGQTQVVEPNHFAQPIEKQTPVQQQTQEYTPVQVNSNQEPLSQEIPTSVVKQTAEPAQEYHQVPVNTYSQNAQQVVPETPEKQATYEVPTGQVPLQSSTQQVYNVQQASEKQVSHQQTEYTQTQTHSGNTVVGENVEKQVPYQQTTGHQTQNVETHQQQAYNSQQTVEKQGQYQYHQTEQQNVEKQGQYQYQQTEQQNVEKQGQYQYQQTEQQNVEKQGQYQYQQTEQQNVEKQGQYQYQQTEQQNVEKQGQYQYQQTEQQNIEKQGQAEYTQSQQQQGENVEKQTPVQTAEYVQTHPVQPVHQQVYSVQPVQVEIQVPYQQIGTVLVPEHKISEIEPNQKLIIVQTQPGYVGEPVYNFGDKLQTPVQHQTLSAVPHIQESSVQSSVSSAQE